MIDGQGDQQTRNDQNGRQRAIGDGRRGEIPVRLLVILLTDRHGQKTSGHGVESDRDDVHIADDVAGQRDKTVRFTSQRVDDIRSEEEIDAELHTERDEVRNHVNKNTFISTHWLAILHNMSSIFLYPSLGVDNT